jgi:hypothetical protein
MTDQEIKDKAIAEIKKRNYKKKIPESTMDEIVIMVKEGMDLKEVINDTLYFIDSMKGKIRFL